MISESARMATTKEARYRIRGPNSMPRSVKLIALDDGSVPLVQRLAGAKPERTVFVLPSFCNEHENGAPASAVPALKAWMSDLVERVDAFVDGLDPSDLVTMVATNGDGSDLAASLGERCARRGVAVTVIVVSTEDAYTAARSAMLGRLRRHAAMLIVVNDSNYLEEMLAALRV